MSLCCCPSAPPPPPPPLLLLLSHTGNSHGPTRDTFEKERFGHQAPHKEDEEEEKKWRAEEETKREEMRKEIPDQEPVVEAHKERVYGHMHTYMQARRHGS